MKSKLVLACFFMMSFGAFAQGNGPVNSGVEREYCAIEYSKLEHDQRLGDLKGVWRPGRLELVQSNFNEIAFVRDSEGSLVGIFNAKVKGQGGILSYKERNAFINSLDIPYTVENLKISYYLRHIYGEKFLALDVGDTKMDVPLSDKPFKIVIQIAETARVVCQNK